MNIFIQALLFLGVPTKQPLSGTQESSLMNTTLAKRHATCLTFTLTSLKQAFHSKVRYA